MVQSRGHCVSKIKNYWENGDENAEKNKRSYIERSEKKGGYQEGVRCNEHQKTGASDQNEMVWSCDRNSVKRAMCENVKGRRPRGRPRKRWKYNIKEDMCHFQVTNEDVHNSQQWRQRGSVVSVGALKADDPGSNPRLGLLNEFVLSDPRGKFTTLCK